MIAIADEQQNNPVRRFLVFADSVDAAALLAAMLERIADAIHVKTCEGLASCFDWLAQQPCDAAVIVQSAAVTPATVAAFKRAFPSLALVVLTQQQDEPLAAEFVRVGADDHLCQTELTADLLGRSLRYAMERQDFATQLQQARAESACRSEELRRLAGHDALTSLPNRAYFDSAAPSILKRAARQHKSFSLIHFDLNRFKAVNDNFGHAAGDELLRQVAERARQVVRETDFLARFGSDEFVIVTDLIDEKREVYGLVTRLLGCFARAFVIADEELNVRPAVGVAFYPDAINLNLLIKQADLAKVEAKNKCQDVCFFTPEMEALYARTMQIRTQLPEAAKNTEFHCEFQGYYAHHADGKVYTEALARWVSPVLGRVPPSEFIPVVERSPLNNHLTRAIITQCGLLMQQAAACGVRMGRINVNVSASQLSDSAFVRQFLHWVYQADIDPRHLCLELTEREIVQNIAHCGAHIHALRKEGVAIALDDFGSGYASITHLVSLPIDLLKLDRMLVHQVEQSPKYQALNAGIVEMAHRLEMGVVAEGIETELEYQTLRELGCDFYQGYYFSRPQSLGSFVQSCVGYY